MAIVKVGQHSDQDDRGQDAAYDERPHQPCHSSASWNSAGCIGGGSGGRTGEGTGMVGGR